jgi:hypothetical protein
MLTCVTRALQARRWRRPPPGASAATARFRIGARPPNLFIGEVFTARGAVKADALFQPDTQRREGQIAQQAGALWALDEVDKLAAGLQILMIAPGQFGL